MCTSSEIAVTTKSIITVSPSTMVPTVKVTPPLDHHSMVLVTARTPTFFAFFTFFANADLVDRPDGQRVSGGELERRTVDDESDLATGAVFERVLGAIDLTDPLGGSENRQQERDPDGGGPLRRRPRR